MQIHLLIFKCSLKVINFGVHLKDNKLFTMYLMYNFIVFSLFSHILFYKLFLPNNNNKYTYVSTQIRLVNEFSVAICGPDNCVAKGCTIKLN